MSNIYALATETKENKYFLTFNKANKYAIKNWKKDVVEILSAPYHTDYFKVLDFKKLIWENQNDFDIKKFNEWANKLLSESKIRIYTNWILQNLNQKLDLPVEEVQFSETVSV